MEKSMAKEYFKINRENMKESLKMIKNMVREFFTFPIKIDMKDHISMMSFMAKDFINIIMEIIMMVNI